MARRVEAVPVPMTEGNRDSGKTFLITEWPAAQAEKWAFRAFLLLKGSNQRIPDDVAGMGMVGVAIVGLNVFLGGTINPHDLEPLLDEMMTCVKIVRDPKHPELATPIVSDDDIEEVQTRLWLRSEVLRIHTNFSAAEAISNLLTAIQTPVPNSGST